jgi:hypothetical protein
MSNMEKFDLLTRLLTNKQCVSTVLQIVTNNTSLIMTLDNSQKPS